MLGLDQVIILPIKQILEIEIKQHSVDIDLHHLLLIIKEKEIKLQVIDTKYYAINVLEFRIFEFIPSNAHKL
jgi:hypothetical protein